MNMKGKDAARIPLEESRMVQSFIEGSRRSADSAYMPTLRPRFRDDLSTNALYSAPGADSPFNNLIRRPRWFVLPCIAQNTEDKSL